MIGGVLRLENNVLRRTFIVLELCLFFFYFPAVRHRFNRTATGCSPEVMGDAGVELVACFQKLMVPALLFQAILDLLQGHVAGADLLRGQLPCVHRHHDSLTDVKQEDDRLQH